MQFTKTCVVQFTENTLQWTTKLVFYLFLRDVHVVVFISTTIFCFVHFLANKYFQNVIVHFSLKWG